MYHDSLDSILNDFKNYIIFISNIGVKNFYFQNDTINILNSWNQSLYQRDSLNLIQQNAKNCNECVLHKTRKNVILGQGNSSAKIIFVGHFPSEEDDSIGYIFSGETGELLTRIIKAVKLSREEVYLSNILKCRLPQESTITKEDAKKCLAFFKREVDVIKPDFICAMGGFAAQVLLDSNEPFQKFRGHFYEYRGAKLFVTYHPYDILKDSSKKAETWADMQMFMREYDSL
ncbi:MAG: uracil-DNA glycosylase [Desulfobacterales bacterium]|nr:uracil-DNA glycosylase [Desulfobacterales bacterium]